MSTHDALLTDLMLWRRRLKYFFRLALFNPARKLHLQAYNSVLFTLETLTFLTTARPPNISPPLYVSGTVLHIFKVFRQRDKRPGSCLANPSTSWNETCIVIMWAARQASNSFTDPLGLQTFPDCPVISLPLTCDFPHVSYLRMTADSPWDRQNTQF